MTILARKFLAAFTLALAPSAYTQVSPSPAADVSAKIVNVAPAPAAIVTPHGAPLLPPVPLPPPGPSSWTKGGVDVYLYGDVYADRNFNQPADGLNQLYNFDTAANQAHLSFTKVSIEKASGVVGFRIDAGYGDTLNLISATDPAPTGFKYLEQFYGEIRPPHTRKLEIDFGKFVTSAGAEVIEAGSNWNYSRSLLFALAIPYYHFGVRATIPITEQFTAGLQLVNGWNAVGAQNSFETVVLVGNYLFKKAVWNNTFLTGPQLEGGVRAYLQLFDTNLVLTPNDKTKVYFNVDYGTNKAPNATRQNWAGIAGAARYQITQRFAAAGRLEWFDDRSGCLTGVAQSIVEATLTGEMKIVKGLVSRIEYRHDSSSAPFYDRGSGILIAKNQNTIALGLIAAFGPK